MAHILVSTAGAAALAGLVACASYPEPVQRLASAEAAERTAEDNGAAQLPRGQLHLRLAQEELAQAKALLRDGDFKRADFVLIRAKGDAELALGEAQAQRAQSDAEKAQKGVSDLRTNATPPMTSITTTTSATTSVASVPAPPATTRTTTTTTTSGGNP